MDDVSPLVRRLLLVTLGLVIVTIAPDFGIGGIVPTAVLFLVTAVLLIVVDRSEATRLAATDSVAVRSHGFHHMPMRLTRRDINDFAYISAVAGGYAGLWSVARAIPAVVGGSPPVWLLEGPALSFLMWFSFFFIVQVTGLARWEGSRLLVNPWFAALIIGGLIAFFTGLFVAVRAHLDRSRTTEAAVVGWVGLLALARLAHWLFARPWRLTRA